MNGAVVAIIAIISGFFGGGIAAVFLEVYLGRRAAEEVGEYDEINQGLQ